LYFIFAQYFNQNTFKGNNNNLANKGLVIIFTIMDEEKYKTKFQLEKEAKDMAIYTEWCELMKEPGAMAIAVGKYLCEKYNIYGLSTIISFADKGMTIGEMFRPDIDHSCTYKNF
jgi:hypothetical protein